MRGPSCLEGKVLWPLFLAGRKAIMQVIGCLPEVSFCGHGYGMQQWRRRFVVAIEAYHVPADKP